MKDAEFITVESLRGRRTYIYKNDKLYNHYGELLETSEMKNLFVDEKSDLKSK